MYRCPECGSEHVKVTMNIVVERIWNGNDIEWEGETGDEREPKIVVFECLNDECGYSEDAYDDDDSWFDGDF